MVVGDQVVDHIAVFRLPSGVTVGGNFLVDRAESLDQLTSELVVILCLFGKLLITSCCRGGSRGVCREQLRPWSSHTWPVFEREQPVRGTGILEKG